jgi:GIY-YIG catalytic domain
MEWKSWFCLPLVQRERLPTQAGIYVIVDAEEQVWYVGRSINLNARWNGKGHHRYKQLSRTNNKRLYQIYWKPLSVQELNEKEQFYIDLFKPHLNYSRVKAYPKRAIQPNQEISRILKVINKQTMLFPDIRSVVLGYYKEADEDEEGLLKELTCIVIAVNLNDHDRVILNSYEKSYSKKRNHLKGCWHVYESQCGSDVSDLNPALIPVFILENTVYEFVCYPGLIKQLAQDKSCLHNLEIAKQTVLALKDTNTLPSMLIDTQRFKLRSEDYLHYRAADLQHIPDLF